MLFLSKKKFSHSVFCKWGTHTSVGGMSSLRIDFCSATLRHGLDQVVNYLHWDGHPLLLECLNNSRTLAGVFILPWTCLFNLFQVCLFGFTLSLGTLTDWGPGENLDIVVGKEPCSVACCMGSNVVMLKCSAIRHLMLETFDDVWNKTAKNKNKKKLSIFEQYTTLCRVWKHYCCKVGVSQEVLWSELVLKKMNSFWWNQREKDVCRTV